MVDAFRKLHPYKKAFTRTNNVVESRIDYIWLSKDLARGLLFCDIISADLITNSDHAIVLAKFAIGIMKRTIIKYNQMCKHDAAKEKSSFWKYQHKTKIR